MVSRVHKKLSAMTINHFNLVDFKVSTRWRKLQILSLCGSPVKGSPNDNYSSHSRCQILKKIMHPNGQQFIHTHITAHKNSNWSDNINCIWREKRTEGNEWEIAPRHRITSTEYNKLTHNLLIRNTENNYDRMRKLSSDQNAAKRIQQQKNCWEFIRYFHSDSWLYFNGHK